jgi:sialate O-acetylesterase
MKIFPLLGLAVLAATLHAEVKCPPVFGDHMVLQCDRPVAVWGEAAPGEAVTVEFAGQSKSTTAASDGKWQVSLDALATSAEPHALTIRGTNTLTYSDILVGEVWFCSGQSNMEKPLGPRKGQLPTDNYEAELARAACPNLRFFVMPHSGKAKPGSALMRWQSCDATALTNTSFSAAAYYFGRELERELGVPVGLVQSSYGGTRIEAWMPPAAFQSDPALRELETLTYPGNKGVQPTKLYQAMIAPFVPFAVRGFLWYQGESNCLNAESSLYTAKMRALIASWRAAWGDADAPFYYVLIAPYAYSEWTETEPRLSPVALPAFWEAQVQALAVPHTGLITTTDLVDDVRNLHPTNKRDVGRRLARLALADTYGRELAAQAPRVKSARFNGQAAFEIELAYAESLHTADNLAPTCFEIAGEDRVFHPADVRIAGDKIVVSSPLVPKPVAVRFAWHELARPNLVNAAGLPALPFRTDDWPLVLEAPKAEVTTNPEPSRPPANHAN